MSSIDAMTKKLNKEADEQGMERCPTCGYKWPKGTEGYHKCSHHMVPRDLLREMLEEARKDK